MDEPPKADGLRWPKYTWNLFRNLLSSRLSWKVKASGVMAMVWEKADRKRVQSYHVLYLEKRAATASSSSPETQPFPGLWIDGMRLYSSFRSRETRSGVSRAMHFTGHVIHCEWTLIKLNWASFLYCLGTQLLSWNNFAHSLHKRRTW